MVLDRNTWNQRTVCKLFVLDRNTWNHRTVYKWMIIDKKRAIKKGQMKKLIVIKPLKMNQILALNYP